MHGEKRHFFFSRGHCYQQPAINQFFHVVTAGYRSKVFHSHLLLCILHSCPSLKYENKYELGQFLSHLTKTCWTRKVLGQIILNSMSCTGFLTYMTGILKKARYEIITK